MNKVATQVKSNVITGDRGAQSADSMATIEVFFQFILCETIFCFYCFFFQAKKATELNKAATKVVANVITGERGTQAIDVNNNTYI